jgi:hypothetical protein
MPFRRAVAALLLAVYLPACTSYRTTTQPVAELTAAPKPPEHIRVTTTAGATVEVNAPRVVNDTLYGSTWTAGPKGQLRAGVMTIPIADIRTVEVRASDGAKTAMLVVGVVTVVSLISLVSACSGPDDIVC